jgi:hypothetical protein
MNAVAIAYGQSAGDVVFDPSLPVEDVHATIHSVALGYYRSIDLLGRSASIRAAVPYAVGNMRGLVAGVDTSLYRSGLADMRVQVSANLIGAPSMNLKEFAAYRRRTTLWTSLAMVIPTGQYDPIRLINIGTNRWAVKPEIALSQSLGKWTVEGYAGVWLYTKNPRFAGNLVRQQSPVLTYQTHVSRNFKRGFWAAGDFTYYHGGATRIADQSNQDFLRNSRMGMTVSIPVRRLQSVKVSYAITGFARLGGRFQTLGMAYSYSWME